MLPLSTIPGLLKTMNTKPSVPRAKKTLFTLAYLKSGSNSEEPSLPSSNSTAVR
jgi:hypothetical protein